MHIEIAVLAWLASITLGTVILMIVAWLGIRSVKRLLGRFLDSEATRNTEAARKMADFIAKVERHMDGADAAIYTMNERINTMSARQDQQSGLLHEVVQDIATLRQHLPRGQ